MTEHYPDPGSRDFYPDWSGRLSACLRLLLENPTGEIPTRHARQALEDWDAAHGRSLYVSPLGDRRERAVPCSVCQRPTLTLRGTCEDCTAREGLPGLASA